MLQEKAIYMNYFFTKSYKIKLGENLISCRHVFNPEMKHMCNVNLFHGGMKTHTGMNFISLTYNRPLTLTEEEILE